MPPAIKDRFAKFTIKGEVRETQFISMSPDHKPVFTSLGHLDGDVLYRIWSVDGTPVTNWLVPEYKGLQYVYEAKGAFSPDNRFLALEVLPWRETSFFRVFDLGSGKRIGDEDIVASGPQPQFQGVGYSRLEFIAETPANSDDLGFLIVAVSDKGDATVFRLQGSGPMQLARNRHSDPIVFARLDPASEWLMSASSDGTVRVSSVREGSEPIGNALQLGIAASSVQRVGAAGLAVALVSGEQRTFALYPAMRVALPAKLEVTNQRLACKRWDDAVFQRGPETLLTPRGELTRAGMRQLRIAGPGEPPLTSASFASDIVLVCLNGAGDRLAVTTSDFVTEVWATDFSRRYGLPLVERRLFGSGRRPATTEMTVLSSDGKSAAVETFFFDPPNVEYRWLSFWDLESALPLADRVPFGDDDLSGQSIGIDASGHYLVVVVEDNKGKVNGRQIPSLQVVPPPSVAPWIADFAEAIGGLSLDDAGSLVPVADRLAKLDRGARAMAALAAPPIVQK